MMRFEDLQVAYEMLSMEREKWENVFNESQLLLGRASDKIEKLKQDAIDLKISGIIEK
jgi:hypothetical protein